MMTATPSFFVLYKPYMPIIFNWNHFFQIFTFEKNLNFCEKFPTEGLELLILLHTQHWALSHHKLMINEDSHPNFFLAYINNICPSIFIKTIFQNFHFWKKSKLFWKKALWRPRTGDITTHTVLSFEAS